MTLRNLEGSPVDWELIAHSCMRHLDTNKIRFGVKQNPHPAGLFIFQRATTHINVIFSEISEPILKTPMHPPASVYPPLDTWNLFSLSTSSSLPIIEIDFSSSKMHLIRTQTVQPRMVVREKTN
jgi:hypothetical protein